MRQGLPRVPPLPPVRVVAGGEGRGGGGHGDGARRGAAEGGVSWALVRF